MQRFLACVGVWLLICLLAAAAEAQPKFRVKLDITESESSKGQVTSYLTRELRSLGDVIVVEDDPAYTLQIVALEIPTMPRDKSAMAMSVVLVSHFNLPRFLEHILELGEYHKDQVVSVDNFLDLYDLMAPLQGIHGHSVRTGLYSDLKDLCQRIVAEFDSQHLARSRPSDQKMRDRQNMAKKQLAKSAPVLLPPELLPLAIEKLEPHLAAWNAKKKREQDISLAQRRLQEAGFALGATDGELGRQTRMALRQYQLQQKLMPSGILDEATRKALGIP